MLSKKLARHIIFPAVTALKLERILRIRSENQHLNLTYHGVVNRERLDFSARHISKSQFESQLKYLKKEFAIIPQSEAFHNYQNGVKTKQQTLSISFDDGFKNNITTALPLLEKHNVPTSFFITGYCLNQDENQMLWPELYAFFERQFRDKEVELNGTLFDRLYSNEHQLSLVNYIKQCEPDARDKMVRDMASKINLEEEWLGVAEEQWKLMTRQDLKALESHPLVEVGSHANNHYNLGIISLKDALADLKKAKLDLEQFFGKEMKMLAYPDGSYSRSLVEEAEKLGHTCQLAVKYIHQDDANDKRIMNRYTVASTTNYFANIYHINRAFKSQGIKI